MTGRWYLPAGDIGRPTYAVHQQASGPLTEIRLGPAGEPWLEFRSLEGLDELIGVLVSARAEHGQAQARHAARPLVPVSPVTEPLPPDLSRDLLAIPANRIGDDLILPDECEHEFTPNPARTHEWCQKCDLVRPLPTPDLPRRVPSPALKDEPICDEKDGKWACTASPLHAGDHASHDRDGNVMHIWPKP